MRERGRHKAGVAIGQDGFVVRGLQLAILEERCLDRADAAWNRGQQNPAVSSSHAREIRKGWIRITTALDVEGNLQGIWLLAEAGLQDSYTIATSNFDAQNASAMSREICGPKSCCKDAGEKLGIG